MFCLTEKIGKGEFNFESLVPMMLRSEQGLLEPGVCCIRLHYNEIQNGNGMEKMSIAGAMLYSNTSVPLNDSVCYCYCQITSANKSKESRRKKRIHGIRRCGHKTVVYLKAFSYALTQ